MKIRARIFVFLLVTYFGGFSAMSAFAFEEMKEAINYSFADPISAEQESSEPNDNISAEDESFLNLSLISFLKSGGSILCYHIEKSWLQGSPKPPFSPPEQQFC